jgi:type I site-specific restriction-modification system R (restriction) subunit
MLGSGVDLIIDPMTYHNMMKKLDKSKGVVIKMGSNEIQLNKMEGTGLFAGSGNESGKISRIKKAGKWRDFSVDTAKQGIDTAKYGYDKYKEATNPVQTKLKKMFGFGGEYLEGGMLSMADIKKSYNKNVKNTKLGKALKETAGTAIGDVYDTGTEMIGNTRHLKGVADALKKGKKGNISKLTQLSGLGLKLQGDGVMKDARYRRLQWGMVCV